jgi:membrane dipeptidase
LPDDVLKAIAATDGVISPTAVPGFLGTEPATIGRWVDHIAYMVDLVGVDHVGIGADFIHHVEELGGTLEMSGWAPDWGERLPPFEGMLGPEDLPGLTAELRQRGFADADVQKIYRDNYHRVFARVLGANA